MLQAVIAASPRPMWVKDAQGRYVGVSPAFASLWGLRADDFVHKHDNELLGVDAAELSAQRDAEALAQDAPQSGVLSIAAPGSEPVQLVVERRRLQQGGRVLGLMGGLQERNDGGVAWDQRERRLLFQFSQVAHELRTPIGGVLGLAGLLAREADLNQRQRGWVETILDCGQHLLSMVNDTVDMGLLCAGQIKLQPMHAEVEPLVNQLVDWMRPQLSDLPVVLVAQCDPAPACLQGCRYAIDAKRLRQVLLNLLSNAVRHTHSGQIRLLVTQRAAAGNSPPRLRFEVEDSGEGMSPERVAELFSGGKVLSGWLTSRSQRRGGMGLLISRRLVHALGGELEVCSALGSGTRFWFEIDAPVSMPSARPASRPLVLVGPSPRLA